MSSGDNISPTAHYTGEVWRRAGLSHPWLGTREGRIMVDALHPLMAVSEALGGPSLESYLLARHRAIDALLTVAVERHGVSQVIEIAAGMSARGWRFANRYGDAHHLRRGRPAGHGRAQAPGPRPHRVAVRRPPDGGDRRTARRGPAQPRSSWPPRLTPAPAWPSSPRGCSGTWPPTPCWRCGGASRRRWRGSRRGATSPICISAASRPPCVRLFRQLLAGFVRGQVYLHFDGATEAEAALREAGFATAAVRRAGAIIELPEREQRSTAHILEASTTDSERRP